MAANHILELEMEMNSKTTYYTDRALECGRHIYNSVLGFALTRYKTMSERKEYKYLLKEYVRVKNDKSKEEYKEQLSNQLTNLRVDYKLTKYQLENIATNFKNNHNYEKYLDSNTVLNIAGQVWDSIEKFIFKKSKKVHFKKFGTFNSLEGKTNKQGIRFIKEGEQYGRKKIIASESFVYWNDMSFKVKIRNNDLYVKECLLKKVKYCRIIRKLIKNKYKYYIQLIFGGVPPVKRINSTGEFRHKVNDDARVGIDIGTSTIAVASGNNVMLDKLGNTDIKETHKVVRRLQRKLDRQRRVNNPNNYNKDSTIKKGIKLIWSYSKGYFSTLKKLKEAHRVKSVKLRLSHNKLSNLILSLGTNVFVEQMSFKGLAKRSKETKKSEKTGKFLRKKRFGKSLLNYGPAMLISIIDRKLKYTDSCIKKVNTSKFKASQYNHVTGKCKKKKLSQRWNCFIVNDKTVKIQRDLYSSYLLMNSKNSLNSADRQLCIDNFDNFLKLHNKEIDRLKELSKDATLPSSFGLKAL